MFIQNIFIIKAIIHLSSSETPIAICSLDKPFEKSDNTCGNFDDICVKKDDLQCNNFLAACKQCPPTNYTVSVLHLLRKQIDESRKNIDDSRKKIVSLTGVIIFLAVFLFVCIIILSVYYLISRKKSKRKKEKHHRFRKNSSDDNLELISNQQTIYPDERIQTIRNKHTEKIIQKINKKNNEKDERIQKIINEHTVKIIQKINEKNNEKEYSELSSGFLVGNFFVKV